MLRHKIIKHRVFRVRERPASVVPALSHDVATCEQVMAVGAVPRKPCVQFFEQGKGTGVLSQPKVVERQKNKRGEAGRLLHAKENLSVSLFRTETFVPNLTLSRNKDTPPGTRTL